jgi:2-oxoglutarate ferredoxin oxidoreductase subunit alpha
VPEINMGQIIREVERCAAGQTLVLGVNRPGGDILEPKKVLETIKRGAGIEGSSPSHPLPTGEET